MGSLVLLILLGFSYTRLLQAVMREQRAALGQFRRDVEEQASTVQKQLLQTEVELLEHASAELTQSYIREPSGASLARLTETISHLVDRKAGMFASILILDKDNRILGTIGAKEPVLPGSFMDLTGHRDGRCGIGFLHVKESGIRLAISAKIPGQDGLGARMLAVFDPRLKGLLQHVRSPGDSLTGGFAVALMETGVLTCSNSRLPVSAFVPLLQDNDGVRERILVDMDEKNATELAGCWLPIGDSPLIFARLVPREEGVGFSSPSLVVAAAVVSGGLVIVLLALLFVIAWQHDRAVREHAELARLDIELQERLGEAKRAQEDALKLTRAFEHAAEAVMVTDRWGALEYVNDAFEDLLGFTAADVMGKQLVDLVPPDEAQRLKPLMLNNTHTPWSRRIRCRHRDGERLRLDVTVAPVLDEDNETAVNYIILARDARNDLQLAERTLQARKLEAIGRLANGLAHDFNNVLQIILGYAGEMVESAEHPELQDSLGQILAAGQIGSELTSRLIAFSRQQVCHREPASINDVLRGCAPTIQKRLGSNVDLQLHLGDIVWNVLVDSKRMEQVLIQLAENARDAMPDGGTVTIRTTNTTVLEPLQSMTSDLPAGDYIQIDVVDTGRGITPEDLEQIFEPLFTTRSQGGLKGMGLCVVHGTIAQHGGGIIVSSAVGKGTTFQIYLPRCVDASTLTDDDTSELTVALQGEGQTVLLAEDEEPVRHVAARLLAKAGYKVVEAVDGKDAITKFDAMRHDIDLALLDIVMPEVSGAIVAEHIRRTSPETPILFCSGYAKHQLPDGIDLPEDIPLIGKPYEPRRLMDAIAALLDK